MLEVEAISKALNLSKQAKNCLERSRIFLRNTIVRRNNNNWGTDKLLSENDDSSGVGLYGTACVLSALVHCSEPLESRYVKNCLNTLLSDEFRIKTGGWSTRSVKMDSNKSMVNATCYALNAILYSIEDQYSLVINKEIEYLIQSRNSSQLWGHYISDNENHFIEICNVVTTVLMASKLGYNTPITTEIYNATDWIKGKQDPDSGGWIKGYQSSAYTAISLLALNKSSEIGFIINNGANFLLENTDNWETEIETFQIGNLTDEYYHIFTKALAISALIKARVYPCTKRIILAVEELINLQNKKGYWASEDNRILAWKNMWACIALKDFIDIFESWSLIISGSLNPIILLKLENLETRINNNNNDILQLKGKWTLSDFWVNIKRNWLIFIGILFIIGFAFFMIRKDINPIYWLAEIVGLILLVLGIYYNRKK